MKRLEKRLQSAASATSFSLDFDDRHRPDEQVLPEQLRRIYERNRWDDVELRAARSATINCPTHAIHPLESDLRDLFSECIDPVSDSIGSGFPIGRANHASYTTRPDGLNIVKYETTVDDFATGLLKAAAIMGTKRVVRLLSGWLDGEPVLYRTCALLVGALFDRSVTIPNELEIVRLPLSSDELPGHLPKFTETSARDYLGAVLLSIDCSSSPAVFRPSCETVTFAERVAYMSTPFDLDVILDAASIKSAGTVGASHLWFDFGELGVFSTSYTNDRWGHVRSIGNYILATSQTWSTDLQTGVMTLIEDPPLRPNIEQAGFETILCNLSSLSDDRIRLAASRLARTMSNQRELRDKMIDLRIALEALFARNIDSGSNQELSFRLALFGAWYLGGTLAERRSIQRTLRAVYAAASKAVHGTEFEDSTTNRDLFSSGRNLVRKAILKMLDGGVPSSDQWTDMVLGVQYER